jgi:hypothetical protein
VYYKRLSDQDLPKSGQDIAVPYINVLDKKFLNEGFIFLKKLKKALKLCHHVELRCF